MKRPVRIKTLITLVLMSCVIILAGCGETVTPEPTMDMNAFGTAAVQTIEANYTETALAQPTNTPAPTNTPIPIPTDTPEPVVVLPIGPAADGNSQAGFEAAPDAPVINSELPGVPPTAIPAPVLPTATSLSVGNKAAWEGQTPVDGTHIQAGSEFDITWYMRNTGTTTWTTDYACRYFSNTNLTKRVGQRFNLPYNVEPNAIGECTIDAVAPGTPGTYSMAYVLSDAEDNNFYMVDITIIVD